ncbi:ubiquinol-cytochrome c reductase core subunit 1 [Phycomyces blakesleeanus NRRL 1555(-)]|uniref:Ubiquinol-cytochrome c reductase core subunit 1 n=1 Tax=Phycomyces blakesleeanus (strain ATCC 8743b / DSM 1359 / FGSC 10004 / NBRC 33097 / NRRL 1555) TaxID=763407 RepID=A0A167PHM6_PHYB8|nr:ubiquinol-cytochrome c reductase core subunit 1 [Phycomyces blakesleeanus NRRL 1555(-)]OAD77934.1 ubiquinol-cytochrome c reductase core subunit 1 [Phycomyces blakesleeanus NRRL 1555(-)]|eukprot:XP_018295974.1 ubiquinol-cytochrome c reductase core subunit 1 [Phycomyces blakesleeanus NRRL 1555(-)]
MVSNSSEWISSGCGKFCTYKTSLEKSVHDHRKYRLIRLENQLEVLLVSDPDTNVSSAALDVHVGHLSDPDDFQGLAHFCEHLLFMGTKKYPRDNEYRKYLADHSGQSNAFTGTENTQYYFEIDQKYLEGALDRFSQFFVSPLFSETCAERELNIINSEHDDNKQNDHWRKFQLEKSLGNPSHPFCHFGTGNHETLCDDLKRSITDIRSELINFYKSYYSANIMKLCILGKDSLDCLTELAVDKFKEVPNKNISPPQFPDSPLTSNELLKQIFIKPIKNIRNIDIVFPFPDQYPLYAHQPENYISRLIGHEGKGSLFSLFKNNGWAESLEVSAKHGGIGFGFYSISVDLTEKGQSCYKDIVVAVFQYIKLIKEIGVQESFFTEFQSLSRLEFEFGNNEFGESAYVSDLAGLMQRNYHPNRIINGSHIIQEYNPTVIQDNLNWLRTDNFRLLLTSQEHDVECTLREKWYGTEYQVLEFDTSFKKKLSHLTLHPELHLPLPNIFIPLDYQVHRLDIKNIKKKPDLIIENPKLKLWHKKDDTFWIPKANVWVFFKSKFSGDTAANSVRTMQTAGLIFSLKGGTHGLELIIDGFNDKLPFLFEMIIRNLLDFKVDPKAFISLREKLVRSFENFEMEQPLRIANHYLDYLAGDDRWTDTERLYELRNTTVEDIELFYSSFLSELHIEALVNGNISKEKAIYLFTFATDLLNYRPLSKAKLCQSNISRSVIFPKGTKWLYQKQVSDPEIVDSGVLYMIQIGNEDNKWERARLNLVAHISREPFFNQLRTKEHLGYTVFSGMNIQAGHTSYRLMVQSNNHTLYVERRIEEFLKNLGGIVEAMSDTEYMAQIQSLVHKKLGKMKSIGQEGDKYWSHIRSGYYNFEQDEEDADELKKVTKESLVNFIKRYIEPESAHIRRLSVHIQSHNRSSFPSWLLDPGLRKQCVNRIQEHLGPKEIRLAGLHELKDTIIRMMGSTPLVADTLLSVVLESLGNNDGSEELNFTAINTSTDTVKLITHVMSELENIERKRQREKTRDDTNDYDYGYDVYAEDNANYNDLVITSTRRIFDLIIFRNSMKLSPAPLPIEF